jgi:hypothetical protein
MKKEDYIEIRSEIIDSAREIAEDFSEDTRKVAALEVARQFSDLESIAVVKQARGLYRKLIEELEVEPSVELISAAKNAVIHFGEEKSTIPGALVLNELLVSGEIKIDEDISDIEIESIENYLEIADYWGIDRTNIRDISRALGIPDSIIGLELIKSVTSILEEKDDALSTLFSLGLISQYTMDTINANGESDLTEFETNEEDDPAYWESLEEDENNIDSKDSGDEEVESLDEFEI